MLDESTVARIPFLAAANAAARREAELRGALATFADGQVLWRAGAEPRGLFVILDGAVRVVRARDGRQQVVHVETAGATLGEVPLFASGRYPATAVAAAPTTCAVLDRAAVEAAIAADAGVAFALLESLAGRVRTLVDRLDRRAQPVAERLRAVVLARHEAAGGGTFTLGRTQAELAEELGTVREVLVREVRALVSAGVLERVGRGRFRVPPNSAARLHPRSA
jgi:CRP/FNR family transcriptional regulator